MRLSERGKFARRSFCTLHPPRYYPRGAPSALSPHPQPCLVYRACFHCPPYSHRLLPSAILPTSSRESAFPAPPRHPSQPHFRSELCFLSTSPHLNFQARPPPARQWFLWLTSSFRAGWTSFPSGDSAPKGGWPGRIALHRSGTARAM